MTTWSLVFAALLGSGAVSARAQETPTGDRRLSLVGEWRFRLDPSGVGLDENWQSVSLPDTIRLPGSTDEQGFGQRTLEPAVGKLTRVHQYVGPAWYEREIVVPADWAGKRVTLFLERCHWETRAWVDGRDCGTENSLVAPHVHDLTVALIPGRHRLTLRVDNTLKIDIGSWGHSVTDETQTDWNGIVGRLELRATDPVWVKRVDVYPEIAARTARVRVVVGNATGKPAEGALALRATPQRDRGGPEVTARFSAAGPETSVETRLPLGEAARLWDESTPSLYDLTVALAATQDGRALADDGRVTFGLREFGKRGTQFALNGRTTFLRGTLECCIFPLTGYPSMDLAAWTRLIGIAKSYGLNHMRFHSWCPPEAAFVAADEAGFTFQVEAPLWVGDRVDADPKRAEFIQAEVDRILATYGNHPSFCLLSMGNELLLGGADSAFLQHLVDHCRAADPRHLYTCCSAPYDGRRNDDYFVSHVGPGGLLRGSGHLNSQPPSTDFDYSRSLAGADRPIVAHELGQWAMFPNFAEIAKYTGALQPRNFDGYRESLARHGMLDQAEAFRLASGALTVSLYKEEIELVLRTPGIAGFQLLDVRDFPGQGTALVGMLDPFWDSKGLITPAAFRRYCSPTVPLLRMKKREWTTAETFAAQAQVAHYGAAPLAQAIASWSVKDDRGREVAAGKLPAATLAAGGLASLGEISLPLAKVRAPARLVATLALDGTDFANDWSFWVYPETTTADKGAVVVADDWTDETRAALAAGKRVLLLPHPERYRKTVPGAYTSVFWCFRMFAGQAGTMGILCDPRHPALAAFPTESHSDWQWWDLLTKSRPLILDDAPANYRPLVQVIDNFDRNHKLGTVFEAGVGPGRLLVSTINLRDNLDARPAARQLLASLLAYMNSEAFQPRSRLGVSLLDSLFEASPLLKLQGAPKDPERAVLDVKAAVNVPLSTSLPWQPEHDQVTVAKPGFGYHVAGGTWRDERGSAWHDPHLVVTVTCAQGFEGTLYAHFHDWNNLGRTATVTFEGRELGLLGDHAGNGVWLALPVTAQDSADGRLEVAATALSGPNVMITRIVLVPK